MTQDSGGTMPKRILFVCTGNTCRSPMAHVLFKNMVNRDPSLLSRGIEVDSAGTIAGVPAAMRGAIEVMRQYRLDMTTHRPKSLNSRLVNWADLILVMEGSHRQRVITRFPEAADKIYLLSEYAGEEGDVPDPYGCGIETYRRCASVLQSLLMKAATRLKTGYSY